MQAEVALPIPVDATFTYRIPEAWIGEVEPGHRVVVSFGPRTMTGVVVEVRDDPRGDVDGPELKPLEDVPDDYPALTPALLSLTRWISEYYVCGWGEAIRAALPPGLEIESETTVARTDRPLAEADVTDDVGRLLEYLEGRDDVSIVQLRRRFPFASTARLRQLERSDFVRLSVRIRGPRASARLSKFLKLHDRVANPEAAREAILGLRGAKQRALMEVLLDGLESGTGEVAFSEALSEAKASSSTARSLAEKDMLEIVMKEEDRLSFSDIDVPLTSAPRLHAGQSEALESISRAVAAGEYASFLLRGVTGSGKTEVYIAALARVLSEGRSGIILVPEIALTPQMVARFRSRFGDSISVLHSRMSIGERFDAWRALREGRHRIVIGPRSAIFAPVEKLGLIVIDEEHEDSYKQIEPAPRYHARDTAVMRAYLEGATCVLGSATPSLESYTNAQHGKYTVLSMPDRVPLPNGDNAVLPEVEIVDLALERRKHQLEGSLSERLRSSIADRLARSEQVILLQNRRGFAPVLECEECGFAPSCPDCSVTFTYHKAINRLRCHYCGRTQRVPVRCPSCGSTALAQLGAGTQRVEEEIATVFPEARVLRMDLDTTGRKHSHHRILSAFGEGAADILLGTQMVAKGLDFGRVTLVGVVNADTELLLPDFRAEERTFQLLTQVAGRAGRAERPGQVILQTRNSKNPALTFALLHDYRGFAEHALGERRALGYPPYGQLAVVTFSAEGEDVVRAIGTEWTTLFRDQGDGMRVLGPHPAFIRRVRRRYRYQTVIRVEHRQRDVRLQQRLRAATAAYGTPPSGGRIAIDVDAVGIG